MFHKTAGSAAAETARCLVSFKVNVSEVPQAHFNQGHWKFYLSKAYVWYGFLFAFHSRPNYGLILYHFRDKAKWRLFHSPCFRRHCGGSRQYTAITFGAEWYGYLTVQKVWWCLDVSTCRIPTPAGRLRRKPIMYCLALQQCASWMV